MYVDSLLTIQYVCMYVIQKTPLKWLNGCLCDNKYMQLCQYIRTTYLLCIQVLYVCMYVHLYTYVCSLHYTVASSINNTMSMILNPDAMMNEYSVVVTCEINPTSTADYCNVYASNVNGVVSSKLPLHSMYMQYIRMYCI